MRPPRRIPPPRRYGKLASLGLSSALALAGSAGVALAQYRGPLWLGNLTISELGLAAASPAAALFNGGLLVSGLLLASFLLGLGRLYGSWPGACFAASGVATGLATALVGVYPVDHPLHAVVGPTCFLSSLISVSSFLTMLIWPGAVALDRWLIAPSLLVILGIGIYMSLPLLLPDGVNQIFAAPDPVLRPAFWIVAISEWCAFGLIIVWISSVAMALGWRSRSCS
jgi:hypothetical membrane protein